MYILRLCAKKNSECVTMNMMSVEQIAKNWNLSVRTVQHLCKTGKIPGAVYFGKSWMIPSDAVRPADRRKKAAKPDELPPTEVRPLVRKTPFLTMTDLYHAPGTADRCAENLAYHPEAQTLFTAQIAYCRGEIDEVYRYANYFLESHSGYYAVLSGGILLALCAIWKGDLQMWNKAKNHMYEAPCKDEVDRDIVSLAISSIGSAIRNAVDFPEWFTRGCFDNLPRDAHPAARVYYIKNMLITAQEVAFGNVEMEGVRGLSLMKTLPFIMEPMISQMVVDNIIMAEINLRLLCAVAYHQTGDDIRGGVHLDKAIHLCLADGLYGPLVEYRRQLGLFLDDHLAAMDPDALKTVKTMYKQYHTGWTKLHNAVSEKKVQTSLTIREREVARFAAYGLSNSAIAKQLSLSEHTVISLINSAKNKTQAENRSDLGLYI